jgi:signal transduction histidine kinase
MVRVQVRDDGCGFNPEEAFQRSGHWGLITMRERALEIGGSLSISSAPGQGTEIDILAPIH